MTERIERIGAVVIGAGVVGLAVARALAQAGREVVVVEARPAWGTETSARNSEVIHAGIYYPPGSDKARLCVRGRAALYEYLAARGVEHRRTGKLVVATAPDEHDALEAVRARARENGVDLAWLDGPAAMAREPALCCEAALWSEHTGIVDSHGLMRALWADAEAAGAVMAVSTAVVGGRVGPEDHELVAGDTRVRSPIVVNAAGLWAHDVARAMGVPPGHIPARYLAKGTYFTMRGRSPFRHLIYPVPASASLGIHLTLDLGGGARLGPDQQWVDSIDYDVDPARAQAFYPSVRRWYPGLADGALTPGYAGIRPKIQAPGEPMADFVIAGPRDHGLPGLVNLFGIESPGLTACLAIADEVVSRVAHG